MSFEEKSNWAMLAALAFVYGNYFQNLWSAGVTADAAVTDYRTLMFGTVVTLIVIVIIAHIVIAIFSPADSDVVDERDRAIGRSGEVIGGYIASAAALTGMGMAMFEQPYFLIANTVLAGLVLSEVAASLVKIYFYRRGYYGG